eukprot:14078739-Ditylum_brightwellii.AAC.1
MPGGGGLGVNSLAGMNNGNNASAPAPSAMVTAGSSGALQQSQQSMPGADATPNPQVETISSIEEEDIPTRVKSSD